MLLFPAIKTKLFLLDSQISDFGPRFQSPSRVLTRMFWTCQLCKRWGHCQCCYRAFMASPKPVLMAHSIPTWFFATVPRLRNSSPKMENLIIIYLTPCCWKVRWSSVGNKTFLELQIKNQCCGVLLNNWSDWALVNQVSTKYCICSLLVN